MRGGAAMMLSGFISLLAGSYLLLNEGLTGIIFIVIGWALLGFGIRKVVVAQKEVGDA